MQTDNSPRTNSPLGDSLFASRVKQIEKTNQMLSNLEHKLNGFFNERKDKESPNTRRHDFKVFNKSLPKPQLEELMNKKTELSANKDITTERECRSQQVSQMDRMQKYYKRKNALIENKILQLQRDVEVDQQDKLTLYQQNQRLERELKSLYNALPTTTQIFTEQETAPSASLEILELERILLAQKDKNNRVRKELEMLKQNYKTLKKTKTQYMQEDIRRSSVDDQAKLQIQKLRQQLHQQKDNYKQLKQQFTKNQQMQVLSKELKKLKQLVSAKSKLKIK